VKEAWMNQDVTSEQELLEKLEQEQRMLFPNFVDTNGEKYPMLFVKGGHLNPECPCCPGTHMELNSDLDLLQCPNCGLLAGLESVFTGFTDEELRKRVYFMGDRAPLTGSGFITLDEVTLNDENVGVRGEDWAGRRATS